MTKKYRVAAEFDVVVHDENEAAAKEFAERYGVSWIAQQERQGHRVETTGGSPEVVIRGMLDNPAQLGSLLAMATLDQGSRHAPVEIENFNLKPLGQTEE